MRILQFALATALLLPGVALAEEGFRPLTEWRAYGASGIPSTWQVTGNDIVHSTGGGGDLVSAETFRNFELAFDWRVEPGGNSGVMYRVVEELGATYESGPEYQILDNAGHADGASPLTSAASVYGLYGPQKDVSRPAGEWNSGRIVIDGKRVEHWLNATKVVVYELGSDDWQARVAASKFAAWPSFGAADEGRISLQDHGNEVAFRNVRIRELPD